MSRPIESPRTAPAASRLRPVPRSRTLAVAMAALACIAFTACGGDDDDATPEEAFCEAGDSLRSSITDLADLDIISGGTDALQERLDAVRSDVDDLRSSGADVAEDEVAALDDAVSALGDAVDGLGDEISIDSGREAVAAITDVVSAAGGVTSALGSACE